jgi:hypothetical protein
MKGLQTAAYTSPEICVSKGPIFLLRLTEIPMQKCCDG